LSGDSERMRHVTPVLDLRIYRLVPDGRETFERILTDDALPMLRRDEIDVVGYGPSVVDDVHYYLARAFSSMSERERKLEAFYGSDEWRHGYNARVTELIESYHTVVIPWTWRSWGL
jgi:hypothetical protein